LRTVRPCPQRARTPEVHSSFTRRAPDDLFCCPTRLP